MKIRLYIFSSVLFLSTKLLAQNYYLNLNPLQSLVAVNPSFAGSNGGLRFQSQFNYQGFEEFNANKSNVYSFNCVDLYLKELKAGLSISCFTRNKNYFNKYYETNQSFNVSYAHYFSFYKEQLKIIPSLQFGYNSNDGVMKNRMYIKSKLIGDYFGIAAGLLIKFKSFYVGISQERYPKEFKEHLPANTSIYLANDFSINSATKLNVSYWYKGFYYGDYNQQLNWNLNLCKHFIAGIGFQIYAKVYPLVNVGYRHQAFTIQCLYAPYTSNYTNNTGIFQIATNFNLRYKNQKDTLRNFENW